MIDYAALDSVVGQNWYDLDPDLRDGVRATCPSDDWAWADGTLRSFGELVGGRLARNADIIDAAPPRLERWDRWATEVDEVVHHPAALDSKRALWASGYVSGFAPASRERERERTTPAAVYAASTYLLSQADTGMVCSLGMTGGVAGLVESYAPLDVRDRLLAGLRGTDVDEGLDGSMFLTERDGGSDLGRTVHCTATDLGDGRVLIDGEKWFCSNVDGAAIVMLARPVGAPEGAGGLGLYLVPRDREDGTRNGITIRRLKNKLGTRSVPTGEVEFRGALGYALRPRREGGELVTTDAGGLNRMMEMVNGSRFGVALMGLGIARRSFLEAAVWAHHRRAKGRLLVDLPLAREQLVDLAAEVEAALALAFSCATASRLDDGARLRRILVPAAKVRLCRLGVEAASFAVELHGGNGYCEDWGLARLLRDAQCHPIWEGSENICTLDVLRAIRREAAHEALLDRIDTCIAAAGDAPPWLAAGVAEVASARARLAEATSTVPAFDADRAEAGSARLVTLVVATTCAALVVEQAAVAAAAGGDWRKGLVALRYIRRHIAPQGVWDDGIAATAAREILAYAPMDEALAQRAAT